MTKIYLFTGKMHPKRPLLISMVLFSVFLITQTYLETSSSKPIDDPPIIFIVTPTYPRATQLADMTRLCNTLRHLPSVYWIVVDDSTIENLKLRELLESCNVPFAFFCAVTPRERADGKRFGRGVHNRNAALAWIRREAKSVSGDRASIVYFADDDNAYDIRLFEEIRRTKKVSMFPVGCIGGTGVSTPVILKNGTLLGFHDPFYANRAYPVDMAGFAIGADLILNSTALFEHKTGYLEDRFLRKLRFKYDEIEFLAENCTQILVWHVKTRLADPIKPSRVNETMKPLINETNLLALFEKYT